MPPATSHAAVEEELFDLLQQCVAGEVPVALDLDIDLVHLQLAVDAVPVVGQVFRVFETLHDADRDVDGDVEVGVIAGPANAGEQQRQGGDERRQNAGQRMRMFHRIILGLGYRVSVDDAPAAGGEVNPAINARVAGDVADGAELMLVVVDAHPGGAGVIGTEEARELLDFAGQIQRGKIPARAPPCRSRGNKPPARRPAL